MQSESDSDGPGSGLGVARGLAPGRGPRRGMMLWRGRCALSLSAGPATCRAGQLGGPRRALDTRGETLPAGAPPQKLPVNSRRDGWRKPA